MEYKTVLLEKQEGVAKIVLNRPEKLNAWSLQMGEEFLLALSEIENDPEVRVVVITGSGRAFCAGADIDHFNAAIDAEQHPAQRVSDETRKDTLGCTVIRKMPVPFIASINGIALGVGLTLPLACDIRIASEKAKLGAIFSRMGLIPEFGSTYNLPHIVGIAKACELVFTGKVLEAVEAEKIGLVNQVVPHDSLDQFTMETARKIAEAPPLAIQMAKLSLYHGLASDFQSQSIWERLVQNYLKETDAHKDAVRAFLGRKKTN